jgi:16S rRNA (uracil1498-N3)-methyltransferase
MSTPRFFVPDTAECGAEGVRLHGLARGSIVTLPAAVSHHARRVLRLRPDDAIALFDGQGNEYQAVLVQDPAGESANGSRSAARILAGGAVDREACVAITLVQALSAQEKIDWLLEKCVELGVRRLVLAPAGRSVVRLDAARQERRLARWRDIAVAACCQCGRNRLPLVSLADNLGAALQLARDDAAQAWILDPAAPAALAGGAGRAVGRTAGAEPRLACAVGPEGGFTPAELVEAESRGYTRTRLGPRVLRTETAGLAVVTALLALHGEYTR